MRRWVSWLIALALPGCAVGRYLRNRALDATDIIDLQFGVGLGYPGVAKVQVTDYVGAILGFGAGINEQVLGRRCREGRHDSEAKDFQQFWNYQGFLLFGMEDYNHQTLGDRPDRYVVGGYRCGERPPLLQRFRVGGQMSLLVTVEAYVNFGELFDFVAGIFGFDPAGDDEPAPALPPPPPRSVPLPPPDPPAAARFD